MYGVTRAPSAIRAEVAPFRGDLSVFTSLSRSERLCLRGGRRSRRHSRATQLAPLDRVPTSAPNGRYARQQAPHFGDRRCRNEVS